MINSVLVYNTCCNWSVNLWLSLLRRVWSFVPRNFTISSDSPTTGYLISFQMPPPPLSLTFRGETSLPSPLLTHSDLILYFFYHWSPRNISVSSMPCLVHNSRFLDSVVKTWVTVGHKARQLAIALLALATCLLRGDRLHCSFRPVRIYL